MDHKLKKTQCFNVVHPQSINDLPSEILLYIFSYCETNELISLVCKVCEYWKKLIFKDVVLWKHRWLKGFHNISLADVEELLKDIPNYLDSFQLRFSSNVMYVDILSLLHKHGKNVCRLKLFGDSPDNNFDNVLNFLLKYYPNIEHLDLFSSGIFGSYELLPDFPSLKTLILVNSRYDFKTQYIKTLADKCQSLIKFSVLSVRGFSDYSIEYFVEQKKNCLQVLQIEGYGLNESSFISISTCLFLYKLTINDARTLNSEAYSCIIRLPCLKFLTLRRCNIQSDILEKLWQDADPCLHLLEIDMLYYYYSIKLVMPYIFLKCPKLKSFSPLDQPRHLDLSFPLAFHTGQFYFDSSESD